MTTIYTDAQVRDQADWERRNGGSSITARMLAAYVDLLTEREHVAKERSNYATEEEGDAFTHGWFESKDYYDAALAERKAAIQPKGGEVVDVDAPPGGVLHAIDKADVALSIAGLGDTDILRIELKQAREIVATMLTTQPTQHFKGLLSSEGDWTVVDCPGCGRCVTYSKKDASSKEAFRDLYAEVVELRKRAPQHVHGDGGDVRGEPRFFIDHTMIHDRLTGKHVTCDPDFRDYVINPGETTRINNPDGISSTCALLNELASHTPARSVSEEDVEVFIKEYWNYDHDAKDALDDDAMERKATRGALEHYEQNRAGGVRS